MRRRVVSLLVALFLIGPAAPAWADAKVRVGLLQFGTVHWLLDTIQRHGLDKQEGFSLEITPLASTQATTLALQGKAVDVITTDWLWVARQRSEGADFTFAPYSTALGSVMVKGDSDINSIKALKGKTLAVAGGPLDKSWLMLTAYVLKNAEFDLRTETKQVYAAPPLLTEKARSGEVDAVLNYWPYAARLEAEGFHQLIGIEQVVSALVGSDQSTTSAVGPEGGGDNLAMVGFAFSEGWAKENEAAIQGFLRAADKANAILAKSEEDWQKLKPLMQAENDRTFDALKRRYREGIPKGTSARGSIDAAAIYKVLRELGGDKLVGPAQEMAPGTFWKGSAS